MTELPVFTIFAPQCKRVSGAHTFHVYLLSAILQLLIITERRAVSISSK